MMWTKNFNENDTIMNIRVAKNIGLYQILDPKSYRIFNYKIIYIVASILLLYEFILLILCILSTFYWINNIIHVILQLIIFTNIFFGCCKIIIIITKADIVRKTIEVTCIDFMKYKHYDHSFFKQYRAKALHLFINLYVITCNFVFSVWAISPFIFGSNNFIVLKTMDGTRHSYLFNVYNIFCFMPTKIHNQYFNFLYIVEMLSGLIFVLFMFIFDFYLLSMCYALSNNLKTIGKAYASFDQLYSFNNKNDATHKSNKKILNGIKMIIKDHQNVLTKMEDFINIVRFVILGQLFVASQTIIFLIFIFVMNFYVDVLDSSAQSLKVVCAVPFYLFQLYLPCHLFQDIHNEKDAVQFALYCSNWEEMDIECKQMILLAMRMNSSHKVYLKITIMKLVNSEMFSRAINLCYSIISVLINAMVKIKTTKEE